MPLRRLFLGLFCLALAASAPKLRLPARWICGEPGEALLQVQEASPGTWILRQSKRSNFEAPFLYLLAGRDKALLLDTGAQPAAGAEPPLRATVDRLLAAWAQGGPAPELIVAHSHGHRDHTFGDAAFADRPGTQLLPATPEAVSRFFGLEHWPEGEAELDLGGRRLVILPLPGHEPAHIAVYDATTRSLFTGDTLYPGLLTIRDWPAFKASAARLAAFARRHPVDVVLGAHVEMTRRPGLMYPLETPLQPEEHGLALGAAQIFELDRVCRGLGDFRRRVARKDFLLERVLPPSQDAPSIHGMLVLGERRLFLSHLPMFHAPHDYQFIAEAELPEEAMAAYRADRRLSGARLYTLAPTERWPLEARLQPGGSFEADLYRGHFERGGVPILKGISVFVKRLVHARRFEPGAKPDPGAWIAFGGGAERFLAHRIEGAPDMDQVLAIEGPGPAEGELHLPVRGALKQGQRVGPYRVRAVVYTEFEDLAEP